MVKIPQKNVKNKTPMTSVIQHCIESEQNCHKCTYSMLCRDIQRRGYAKPYQYRKTETIKDKYLEDL